MMIRNLTLSLALLAASSAAYSAVDVNKPAHRFYSVESGNDSTARGIEYTVDAVRSGNVETITLSLRNTRHTPYQPLKAGLKLGIDTYMDSYPEWYGKFFPTLAVCEPNHFYGYMQSPEGKVKAVVSADPIASWSLDYNMGYPDWTQENRWFYGHRIECLNLDMLCRGPLPDHNPLLWKLEPGERRSWTVKIIDLDAPDSFEEVVYRNTGAPVLAMERTSCSPGDSLEIKVWGSAPRMTVDGNVIDLQKVDDSLWRGIYRATEPGVKDINVCDGVRQAHGTVAVRHPWNTTMRLAREAVERYRQKPTSHVESWYGFHTAFDAARIMPEPGIDSVINRRFDMVVDKIFDREKGTPYKFHWRIQNVSSTIGMLADRYLAFGNPADLDLGERMARYVMDCQREDGAYMNGHTDYTSVIYPAKSMLEFADAERVAGRKKQAARIEASARRAIDHLAAADGDLETEGQITYEDGMISCSALQLGELALRSKNKGSAQIY